MRGLLTMAFLMAPMTVLAQSGPPVPPDAPADLTAAGLPDSPGASVQQQQSVVAVARASYIANGTPAPCSVSNLRLVLHTSSATIHTTAPDDDAPSPANQLEPPPRCPNLLNPYARFLDTTMPIPMTPGEKGMLALHDLLDPFNFITIVGSSAVTIAIDSHSAYGPGLKGFGKLTGVSYLQDATGEFFGTFAIPSIVHQDPHYHRMPGARVPRRILHAAAHTVIAEHDDGSPMINYATLLTYPIAAEISNLYVPGIQSDGPSTALRILTGYALDPVNNIVTEFLPDVAKRVHIRIIFVQQILNQITGAQPILQ